MWRELGVRAGSGAGLGVVGRPGGVMLALWGRWLLAGRRRAGCRARLVARLPGLGKGGLVRGLGVARTRG